MTETELQERRRHKWRLDGRPMRTLEEARDFMEEVGFCLMYPLKPAVLAPTFVGAYSGNDENLPSWQQVFADSRATESLDLMVRLLRERAAYETNLYGQTNFLVSAAVFPFFYALMGDRNPRRRVRENSVTGHGKLSALAEDVYRAIQDNGPVTARKFGGLVGGELSDAGLYRALNELWASLMITRVDYNPVDGASWDVLYRWSPEAVREGAQLSVAESVSALVSKYLECVVAAEPREVEDFFAPMVARSRVSEAIKALLTTREFSFSHTGERSLVCMTPPASGSGKFLRMPRVTSSGRQKNDRADGAAPEVVVASLVAPPPPRPRGPQQNSIFKRRIPAAGTTSFPPPPPFALGKRSKASPDFAAAKSRPEGTRPTHQPGAGGSRTAYSRKPAAARDTRDSPRRSSRPAYPKPRPFPPADESVANEIPAIAATLANADYAGSVIPPPLDAGSGQSQPQESSYVKPGFAKSGFAKSGFAKSGFAKSGFAKSRPANPRPANKFAKPGFERPKFAKPEARRSSFGRAPSREGKFADARPAASRTGESASGDPGSSRSRFSRSSDGAPRFGKAGPDRPRPSEKRFGQARPVASKFGKPRFSQPDSRRAGRERPGSPGSTSGKSRSGETFGESRYDTEKASGAQPGRPGFSGTRSSGSRSSGSKSSGARFSGSKFSGSKYRAKSGGAKSGPSSDGGPQSGKSKPGKDGNYLARRGPRKPTGAASWPRGVKIRDLKPKPGSEPER